MQRQQLAVVVGSQLLHEPSRSLNVLEQEGDPAPRELGHVRLLVCAELQYVPSGFARLAPGQQRPTTRERSRPTARTGQDKEREESDSRQSIWSER